MIPDQKVTIDKKFPINRPSTLPTSLSSPIQPASHMFIRPCVAQAILQTALRLGDLGIKMF